MAAPVRSVLASITSRFTRLYLSRDPSFRCFHAQSCPLLFKATNQLWSVPMKRKKKMDPAQLAAREVKRRKKLEKQVKKLEKFGRQLKPIEEINGNLMLKTGVEEVRKRSTTVLTFDESENRALLHKSWSRYCMSRHQKELSVVGVAMEAQQMALDELRSESEELYQQAIQTDDAVINLVINGPVETQPIKGFDTADGDYKETTRKFDK